MVEREDFDSSFAVTKESCFPDWSITAKPLNWDINNRPMKQNVDPVYVESGLYVTTNAQLEYSKLRYGGKIGFIEVPSQRNIDINSFKDPKLAEAIIASNS
jgi:CMP-N-acetylneuraminic acid synthetase